MSRQVSRQEYRHHWGYHGAGYGFEGWYFRLCLPELGQSVAFMYELRPQVAASMQLLTFDDRHYYQAFLPHQLVADYGCLRLASGYFSVSAERHSGRLGDWQWDYQMATIVPWQSPTMGWLSYLPVFAPYWQIMQLAGRAQGWLQYQRTRFDFQNGLIYSEKNWGQAFPRQWYWLQCNHWQNGLDLAIVSAGGIRQTFGQETIVAMVGLTWQGQIYKFMPDSARIFCSIEPWGDWYIVAVQGKLRLELIGSCECEPTSILVPRDGQMYYACRDTGHGNLTVNLWRGDRRLFSAKSKLAALETGGNDWAGTWQFNSAQL